MSRPAGPSPWPKPLRLVAGGAILAIAALVYWGFVDEYGVRQGLGIVAVSFVLVGVRRLLTRRRT